MRRARQLSIDGPAGRLQAELRLADPACAAAVLAHPHPLQGGSYRAPVIFHSGRELHRAGLSTLLFNFRGVGESEGAYDRGNGELDDLAAAVALMRRLAPRLPLLVVGYSFGAWCALRLAVADEAIAGLIAIGLPLSSRFGLPDLRRLRCPLDVVQASEDEFGEPERLRALLRRSAPGAALRVIPETTHHFPGRARDVARAVRSAAEMQLRQLAGR
jgi:alpha/beta superfamily hydrolase